MTFSETLNLWGNGSVTLPKEWRTRYETKPFMAEETAEGYLVIKPIMDIEYFESKDGSFGIRFPMGLSAKDALKSIAKAEKDL